MQVSNILYIFISIFIIISFISGAKPIEKQAQDTAKKHIGLYLCFIVVLRGEKLSARFRIDL